MTRSRLRSTLAALPAFLALALAPSTAFGFVGPGEAAPDFQLYELDPPSGRSTLRTLESYRGQVLIMYAMGFQ